MTWLFVYGSLRVGASAHGLVSGVVETRTATLRDHALYGLALRYPFATEEEGARVVGDGLLIRPDIAEGTLRALDRYEGDEYRRVAVVIGTDAGDLTAQAWVAAHPDRLRGRIESGDWFDVV